MSVQQRIDEIAEALGVAEMLANAADFEKYNKVTGTNLSAEEYQKLVAEDEDWVTWHIPGGAGTYPDGASDDDSENPVVDDDSDDSNDTGNGGSTATTTEEP